MLVQFYESKKKRKKCSANCILRIIKNLNYKFIGCISTIRIAVTTPFLCNACPIGAHEFIIFAALFGTIFFITVISAIIICIATPTILMNMHKLTQIENEDLIEIVTNTCTHRPFAQVNSSDLHVLWQKTSSLPSEQS